MRAGAGAPILLVGTHADDAARSTAQLGAVAAALPRLQRAYPAVKAAFLLSSRDAGAGHGLAVLRRGIVDAAKAAFDATTIPRSYEAVRCALASGQLNAEGASGAPYATVEAVVAAAAARCGVRSRAETLACLDLLDDWGMVLVPGRRLGAAGRSSGSGGESGGGG